MAKASLVWSLTLLALIVVGDTNIPEPLVRGIEAVQKSVFPIVYATVQSDEALAPDEKIEGTGFFLGKEGYFVTAAHVPQAVHVAHPGKTGFIFVPFNGWPRGGDDVPMGRFRFDVVQIDAENDLALCKTRVNPFARKETKDFVRSVVLADTIPLDGSPVGFIGFPFHGKVPMSGQGILGSVAQLAGPDRRGLFLFVHATCWAGVSGARLFLSDGRVVGLVTSCGEKETQGLAGARPARFIKALLRNVK